MISLPIYCINLITAEEKYQRCQKLFSELGWTVTFYRPQRDSDSPARGCYTSHQAVAQEFLSSGQEMALIFEDDIELNGTLAKIEQVIDYARQTLLQWQIFYLGAMPLIQQQASRYVTANIISTKFFQTHAYLIGRQMAETLVNTPWTGIPIDVWYQSYITWAYLPSLFVQGAVQSDINTSLIYHYLYNTGLRQVINTMINYYPLYTAQTPQYWLGWLVIIVIILILIALVCYYCYYNKK